jgi:hypothetical protein
MTTTAIIPINDRIDTAVQNVRIIQEIVRQLRSNVLIANHDYGVIPGTGDKPTLLLPGMEKLMRALNAEPEYIDRCVIRDYEKPLFHYEYECRLVDIETHLTIPGGRGIGLCTSAESGFAWRWVNENEIPPEYEKSTLRTRAGVKRERAFAIDKAETSGKYGKPAEYWQEFKSAIANNQARSVKIKSAKGQDFDGFEIGGVQYRIPNPDIFDQLNAIMKRAKKRALGDAIKGAANVSEFFTVDLEDFAEYTPTVITVEKTSDVVDGEFVEQGASSNGKPETKPWCSKDTIADLGFAARETTGVRDMSPNDVARLGLKDATQFFNYPAWNETYETMEKAVAAIKAAFEAEMSRKPAAPKSPENPPTELADDESTTFGVFNTARYVSGKTPYVLFGSDQHSLTVRGYGRTTTIKEKVGDDYYNANPFGEMDGKPDVNFAIAPLEVTYQFKVPKGAKPGEGYLLLTDAKPVKADEADKLSGDWMPPPDDAESIPF